MRKPAEEEAETDALKKTGIFKFLKIEEISPGSKMKQTLCKTQKTQGEDCDVFLFVLLSMKRPAKEEAETDAQKKMGGSLG